MAKAKADHVRLKRMAKSAKELDSESTPAELRSGLHESSNLSIAKAAEIIGERELTEFVDELKSLWPVLSTGLKTSTVSDFVFLSSWLTYVRSIFAANSIPLASFVRSNWLYAIRCLTCSDLGLRTVESLLNRAYKIILQLCGNAYLPTV